MQTSQIHFSFVGSKYSYVQVVIFRHTFLWLSPRLLNLLSLSALLLKFSVHKMSLCASRAHKSLFGAKNDLCSFNLLSLSAWLQNSSVHKWISVHPGPTNHCSVQKMSLCLLTLLSLSAWLQNFSVHKWVSVHAVPTYHCSVRKMSLCLFKLPSLSALLQKTLTPTNEPCSFRFHNHCMPEF